MRGTTPRYRSVYVGEVRVNSKKIIVALIGLVVIMAAYWSLWYSHRSLVASASTTSYYDFENAFPLADGLLSLAMVMTAWSLWRQRSRALLFGLLASGGGFYLFGMDVLFDLEHGIWLKGTSGLVELAINVLTVVATVWLTTWFWFNRRSFESLDD